MSLDGRTVVISGATGELGSTMARACAAAEANLLLLSNDGAKGKELLNSLALPPERVVMKVVDLLDFVATEDAAVEGVRVFGKIDVLLHVVGGWTGGKTLVETDSNDMVFMINQHIWTSYNLIKAFVPYMIMNGWGRVIMVTSPYAARPNAKGGPYAIGKAGQEALMLTLGQELRGSGVTANLLQAKTIDSKREKISAPRPENASWTTPEELCSAMLFLVSDEAGSVNAAKIPMYGSY